MAPRCRRVQGLRAVPDPHRARHPAGDRRTAIGIGVRIDGVEATGAQEPYCYLTTTGRRSGRSHTIEIWFATGDATLFLISGGGDRSDWVRNLLASPVATVRVGDRRFGVHARLPLPEGPERDRAIQGLYTKYGEQVSSTVDDWLVDAYLVALDIDDRGHREQ